MAAEDQFAFTLKELQMLKVCTEWYRVELPTQETIPTTFQTFLPV